jgi:hypothetical protein
MHNKQLIISASGLHSIMGAAREIDPDLMTPTLEEAKALTAAKRSAEQKQMLADALDGTLSAGGKTYVRDVLRSQLLGFDIRRELNVPALVKGKMCEGDSISFYDDYIFAAGKLRKNEKRFDRDFDGVILTGEPDIIHPNGELLIDIKTPLSKRTMPMWQDEAEETAYYWQGMAYMKLTGRKNYTVAYVLVDTPEDLRRGDSPDAHELGDLDADKRVFEWHFSYSEDAYQLMLKKLAAAGRYYQKLLRERGL